MKSRIAKSKLNKDLKIQVLELSEKTFSGYVISTNDPEWYKVGEHCETWSLSDFDIVYNESKSDNDEFIKIQMYKLDFLLQALNTPDESKAIELSKKIVEQLKSK